MTPLKDPSFFQRLNQTEPFIAIRLIILQLGISLGLYWIGNTVVPPSEEMNLFPFNLMGIFDVNRLIEFGYPLRELIWSGEWWRIPIGIILPPGLGWMFISIIAFLPLARLVESHLGRIASLSLYLAGGLTTLVVDFLTAAVVPSGSIGMVFCAAGVVMGGYLLERQSVDNSWQKIPPGTWMALILSWGFTWMAALIRQTTPLTFESAVTMEIGPSQEAIIASFLFGTCFGIPCILFQQRKSAGKVKIDEAPENPARFPLNTLSVASPVLFSICLAIYCLWGWKSSSSADYHLWRLDPGLREGKNEAFEAALQQVEDHPDDLFLAKRVAVSLAYQERFEESSHLLEKISKKIGSDPKNQNIPGDLISRRYRALCLNRHAAQDILPWRYSTFSGNYDIDPLRLLWDRGHIALLMGATEEVNHLRDQLSHYMDQLIPNILQSSEKGNQVLVNQNQSIVLNHRAYVRVELAGDLALAINEASMSVSLSPSAENLDTLGWVEIRNGKLQSGINHLEKAILYNEPRSAGTIHFHSGVGYHHLGEAEKARHHFIKSLQYDLDWWDELKLKNLCPECLTQASEKILKKSI